MSVRAHVCNQPTCQVLICLPAGSARQDALPGRKTTLLSNTHSCVHGNGDRRGAPPPRLPQCAQPARPPVLSSVSGFTENHQWLRHEAFSAALKGLLLKACHRSEMCPPPQTHMPTLAHTARRVCLHVFGEGGQAEMSFLCHLTLCL